MIKLLCLFVALLPALGLRAQLTPTAAADSAALQDEDVYYAPLESQPAEGQPDAAEPAVKLAPGAYLSRATLHAVDFSDGRSLKGAELFLGSDYLGRSPLALQGLVVAPGAELAVRMDGYHEASRPGLRLPAEGEVRVALLKEDPAGWYTTPAWVLGLGMLAGSVAVYRSDNTAPGLALVGGGVGLIALSQLAARFWHLPALRRDVDAYNAQPVPVPRP